MPSTLQVPVEPNDHSLGAADAPITLVEYGDFECPYCRSAEPVVKSIMARLDGQVRLVFRHFPLAAVHPHAETAAETAELAAEHQRFWPMHDRLFEHQDALENADLVRHLAAVGIPVSEAPRALIGHEFARLVRRQFLGGVRSGVNGTPTFFINGARHDGASDEASLLDAIQSAAYATARR